MNFPNRIKKDNINIIVVVVVSWRSMSGGSRFAEAKELTSAKMSCRVYYNNLRGIVFTVQSLKLCFIYFHVRLEKA